MSNTNNAIRMCDGRPRKWPSAEPLALRWIQDQIKEEGLSDTFFRNVRSYYYALIEIATMPHGIDNENGRMSSTDFIADLSGVRRQNQPKYRKWLEKIRLLQVTHQQHSNDHKPKMYLLLAAPYQHFEVLDVDLVENGPRDLRENNESHLVENGPSQEPSPEQGNPPIGNGGLVENGPKTVETVCSSESTTNTVVDSSERTLANTGRASLRDWTIEHLQLHHEQCPIAPPAGTSTIQMIVAVLDKGCGIKPLVKILGTQKAEKKGIEAPTIERLESFGYGEICAAIAGILTHSGEWCPDYIDWVDGAFALKECPHPANKPPSIKYLLGALREEAIRAHSRRYEAEHQRRKRGFIDAPQDRIVTDQEIEHALLGAVTGDLHDIPSSSES